MRKKAFQKTFNQMVNNSPEPELLDRTFSALADATRRQILERLSEGDCCVTDLAKPHQMSLPAVSKHLRVLENAGLIKRHKSGRIHQLNLEATPMKQAVQWLETYRRFWEGNLDRLDDYLKKLQATQTSQNTPKNKTSHDNFS